MFYRPSSVAASSGADFESRPRPRMPRGMRRPGRVLTSETITRSESAPANTSTFARPET